MTARSAPIGTEVLGYTGSGKPVYVPSRGAPDTNNIDTFQKTRAKFAGWTKADHMDAAKLHEDAAQATSDPKRGRAHSGWSAVHWDLGGRWTSDQYDARHGRRA